MPAYTTITGYNLKDLSGRPLNGRVTFTGPVDGKGNPVSSTTGGNGLILYGTRTFLVSNGVLTGDNSASQKPALVADTSQTNPANVGYTVRFYDAQSKLIPMPGYTCVQPSGISWSLDQYVPLSVLLDLVQLGPMGPQGATGSPGHYGPNVQTATQLGCSADGTDCATLINSFFATATASTPKVLLLDTPGLITVSRLILSPNGNCAIVGMGDSTGFFLRAGTNQSVIGLNAALGDGVNGAAVQVYDPGTRGVSGYTPVAAPPVTAQNVLLSSFRIDGNRGNNPAYFFGIDIVSCKNLRIET